MSSSLTVGNEPGDLSVALGPKTSSPMLQGVLFCILFYFYFNMHYPTPLFLPKPEKSKTKFTIFDFTANRLYEENPSLCSTLESLYCSSFSTAVGFRI